MIADISLKRPIKKRHYNTLTDKASDFESEHWGIKSLCGRPLTFKG